MENKLTIDQLPHAVYQLNIKLDEIIQMINQLAMNPSLDKPEGTVGLIEAANFFRLEPLSIYKNIRKIPHRKRFGILYFYISELAEYINQGK